MKYTDSHAHLSMPPACDHVEEMLQRAQQSGVERVVNICVDAKSLENGLKLQQRHPWVFNAAATTPHDVEKEGESFFPLVRKHAADLVALGETGLDYYHEHAPKKVQQQFLKRYFELACETGLPLIFHCREAFGDLFALSDLHYRHQKGLLHCFTGDVEEAKGCLDRGWLISFSGIITFKKSAALRDAVKYVPLDSLLIETDTPYLAPQSKRGKMNEPSFVIETAALIAELKGETVERVAEQTWENADKFFAFPKQR